MLLPDIPRTALHATGRPVIGTPFGELAFTTAVAGADLPAVPARLFALPGGPLVARWKHHAATVELLLTPHDPELDTDTWGPITGCHAAVWRIDAHAPLAGVRLTAALPADLPPGADSGWDGGQGLTAFTVEDAETRLTVGGWDEEAVCLAAGGETPGRWAPLLDQVYKNRTKDWGVALSTPQAITWRLPPLAAGEHCELPVLAAWAPAADDTANTWYAVMAAPPAVLRQLGGP